MSRRKKGEGTITKLANGHYRARIRMGDKDLTATVKTKAEAKRKLAELKNERDRLENLQEEKLNGSLGFHPTVEEVFEKYLESKSHGRNKIKETSFQRIENTVYKHIIPKCGSMKFNSLTSKYINTMLDDLLDEGLSVSSVRKVYLAFTACFSYAINEECIIEYDKNPMKRVSMKKDKCSNTTNNINYYSEDERRRIEEVCLQKKYNKTTGRYEYKHKYGLAFVLLLNTGLRGGELCALTKDDFNIEDCQLTINKGVASVKRDNSWKTIVSDSPKTKSSIRKIPLNKKAIEMYELSLEEFPEKDLLIHTSTGNLVQPTKLNQYLNKILQEAGVEKKGGVHTLRDTFATALFESGVDVLTVSKLLGHESTRVTEKHYIHVLEEKKLEAVQLLDAI